MAHPICRNCKWRQPVPALTNAAYNRGTLRLFHSQRITAHKADIDGEVVRPTHAPVATDSQLASDGTVWLRTSAQYFQESDTYVRISATDCARCDMIEFDALVRVLDARNDMVLVATQSDDEATAKIYKLVRPTPARAPSRFPASE